MQVETGSSKQASVDVLNLSMHAKSTAMRATRPGFGANLGGVGGV